MGAGNSDAGQCLATFAHLNYTDKGDVTSVAVSADGKMVYTGSSDGSIAAWEMTTDVIPKAGIRKGFL